MPPLDAFLVVLRESLEAFLLLGILVGIVVKLGHPRARTPIYLGALAGVALSILLGLVIHATAQDLFERYEAAFEGVAALVAVAILTYMVVWMYRHTITLVAALADRAKAALASGNHAMLFGLAFVAVAREGVETVLFLATQVGTLSAGGLAGATLAGVGASAILAVLLFTGVLRLSLRGFFAVTGLLLILFAGGMLAYGAHELAEAGWVPETPHVWDTSGTLDQDGTGGALLKAVFGYRDHPMLLELLAYVLYVGGFGVWYLRGVHLAVRAEREARTPKPA